ncbi:hypothetical protein OG985_09600 [Streptomyces sp. NBC_00289]|uniref:hypothetical protein n=1 Tax=Streptomyces sp. NBC_00289 TaxID=2975703 RepID=UPI0032493E26
MKWENVVRIPTGAIVTAWTLSAALLVTGCGGAGDRDARSSGGLLLEPAVTGGPEHVRESGPPATAVPSPVTRTPQAAAPPAPDCASPDAAAAPGVPVTPPLTAPGTSGIPETRMSEPGLLPDGSDGAVTNQDGVGEGATAEDGIGEDRTAEDRTAADRTATDDLAGSDLAAGELGVPSCEPEIGPEAETESLPGLSDEIGPETVPEIPDLRDGGGLIPDADPTGEDGVTDGPADVFDS